MPKEYQGYVAQAQLMPDGTIQARFVPWYQADTITQPDGSERFRPESEMRIPANAFGPPPEKPKKRTAQARLDEMTRLLVHQYQEWGFLPESILREIEGIYWANGQPTTADELRTVAGEYLRMAEAEARRK